MNINPHELDRYITGNYGEDQFKDHCPECEDKAVALDNAISALESAASWFSNINEGHLADECLKAANEARKSI